MALSNLMRACQVFLLTLGSPASAFVLTYGRRSWSPSQRRHLATAGRHVRSWSPQLRSAEVEAARQAQVEETAASISAAAITAIDTLATLFKGFQDENEPTAEESRAKTAKGAEAAKVASTVKRANTESTATLPTRVAAEVQYSDSMRAQTTREATVLRVKLSYKGRNEDISLQSDDRLSVLVDVAVLLFELPANHARTKVSPAPPCMTLTPGTLLPSLLSREALRGVRGSSSQRASGSIRTRLPATPWVTRMWRLRLWSWRTNNGIKLAREV